MAFTSNVTFVPRCYLCDGPNSRPHWVFKHICPDCYQAIRFDAMFEDQE